MTSFEYPVPEKVQGYLEKRSSKVNIWRWWKKYWFVLDGKMLLYFKTKEDYERLGRCRGSVNMSLAQAVQPSSSARRSYPIEVITRTKTIQLSACDEDNRIKWLSALQNAIRLPEISSPVFERLSSRLSANLSLKRPFSQRSSQCQTDDDTDTIKSDNHSINDCYSKDKESIEKTEPETLQSNEDYKTVATTNITTTVVSNGTSTNDGQVVISSNSSSTISESFSDNEKKKEISSEMPKASRQRTLSLYEEIVEEVLEITSRKLSNAQSAGEDHVVEKQVKNEEYLKDFTAILQDEKKCLLENKDIPNKIPPIKPPRTDSVRFPQNFALENLIQNAKLKPKHEIDAENEVYESANESSYVTAESSEYEGDTSSYSSICSNKSNVNSLNTLTENLVNVSTGSEASMESIKPQSGSLCNMLDVTDGSDSCNSNVQTNDDKSVHEEIFTDKTKCIDRRYSLTILEKLKVQEPNIRKCSE